MSQSAVALNHVCVLPVLPAGSPPRINRDRSSSSPQAPGGLGSGPRGRTRSAEPLRAAPSPGSALGSSWGAGRDAGTSSRERKSSRPGACAARSQATPRETIAGAADESTEAISRGPRALHSDARFGHTARPAQDSIGPAAPHACSSPGPRAELSEPWRQAGRARSSDCFPPLPLLYPPVPRLSPPPLLLPHSPTVSSPSLLSFLHLILSSTSPPFRLYLYPLPSPLSPPRSPLPSSPSSLLPTLSSPSIPSQLSPPLLLYLPSPPLLPFFPLYPLFQLPPYPPVRLEEKRASGKFCLENPRAKISTSHSGPSRYPESQES
ncbi:uncharacterized protein AAES06_005477 [Glossophaga mutica]